MTEFHRIGRERLPARRPSVTVLAEDAHGHKFHLTIGFTLDGRVLEIFARSAGRHDSDQDRIVDDIAVLLSRLLQHGDSLQAISEGIGHLPDGGHSSVVGVIVEAAQKAYADILGELPVPTPEKTVALTAAKEKATEG